MMEYKKWLPYLAAIGIFLVVAVGYFSPAILEGKILKQNDILQGTGSTEDLRTHQRAEGESSLWSSSMFSGMPAYQISPLYSNKYVLRPIRNLFELFLPEPAGHVFACFLGFFLLLIALGISPWVSIIGALAYGLSSYFMIIIEAGHIWKMLVLELIPPTFAGVILAYKGKLLWGWFITALFLALQLFSNHIQMTYYFALLLVVFAIGRFVYDYKNHHLPHFFKASAVLVMAAVVAIGCNITNIYLSNKYSAETIRGNSELKAPQGTPPVKKGLDREYATQWSYGIGETLTLLVPDTKGGATGAIGNKEEALNKSSVDFRQNIAQSNRYWGEQPFTSGPVYVGAFIVFLFILSCFLVKGYLKWSLLAATLLSIVLSWGHNLMWITDLFFDYVPMYNKFRAVSSILVIAEITIPLLAIIGLCRLIENPTLWKQERKTVWYSAGGTLLLLGVMYLLPTSFFNFISSQEQASFADQMSSPEYRDVIARFMANLTAVRVAIFKADVLRSIIYIALGIGMLQLYASKKINKGVLIAAIALLVVIDMGGVNKRYLSNDDFVVKTKVGNTWTKTAADIEILKDTDPNYRVMNFSSNPFTEAFTSYYHKSIGGYHGAKLRRYQDLIDHQLSKQNMEVINMLNTKYFIVPTEKGGVEARQNPGALGHAWFVDSYQLVDDANQEMEALNTLQTAYQAVVDKRFETQLPDRSVMDDSTASVTLTDYKINCLTYKSHSSKEGLAVFSEVYYNDGASYWQAYIDGKPVDHLRANYVLRALTIPAGDHTIEFVFKPKAFDVCETISYVCMGLLFVVLVILVVQGFRNSKKKTVLTK